MKTGLLYENQEKKKYFALTGKCLVLVYKYDLH